MLPKDFESQILNVSPSFMGNNCFHSTSKLLQFYFLLFTCFVNTNKENWKFKSSYPPRKFTFFPFIKWSLTNFLELISNIYWPLPNGHLNYSRKTRSLGIPKCLLLLLNGHHNQENVWSEFFIFNVWSHYLLSHLCWANSRITFTELQLSKFKAIMAEISTL